MLWLYSTRATPVSQTVFASLAQQIEQVVRRAFVHAFDGAMLLCMAVSVAGVLLAFLVTSKTSQPQYTGPAPDSSAPRTGQSQPLVFRRWFAAGGHREAWLPCLVRTTLSARATQAG